MMCRPSPIAASAWLVLFCYGWIADIPSVSAATGLHSTCLRIMLECSLHEPCRWISGLPRMRQQFGVEVLVTAVAMRLRR